MHCTPPTYTHVAAGSQQAAMHARVSCHHCQCRACNNIRCMIQSTARTAGHLISHCLLDELDALPSMPSSHAIKQACVS